MRRWLLSVALGSVTVFGLCSAGSTLVYGPIVVVIEQAGPGEPLTASEWQWVFDEATGKGWWRENP